MERFLDAVKDRAMQSRMENDDTTREKSSGEEEKEGQDGKILTTHSSALGSFHVRKQKLFFVCIAHITLGKWTRLS